MKTLTGLVLALACGGALAQGFIIDTAETRYLVDMFRHMNVTLVACPDHSQDDGSAQRALCGRFTGDVAQFQERWQALSGYQLMGATAPRRWQGAEPSRLTYRVFGKNLTVTLHDELVTAQFSSGTIERAGE